MSNHCESKAPRCLFRPNRRRDGQSRVHGLPRVRPRAARRQEAAAVSEETGKQGVLEISSNSKLVDGMKALKCKLEIKVCNHKSQQ